MNEPIEFNRQVLFSIYYMPWAGRPSSDTIKPSLAIRKYIVLPKSPKLQITHWLLGIVSVKIYTHGHVAGLRPRERRPEKEDEGRANSEKVRWRRQWETPSISPPRASAPVAYPREAWVRRNAKPAGATSPVGL